MEYKETFSNKDLREMKKAFEEYAKERFQEKEEDKGEYVKIYERKKKETRGGPNRKQIAFYEDIIGNIINRYIEDTIKICRNKILTSDNAGYFYSKKELEKFKEKYLESGGNINDIHVGKVYDDEKRLMCYEVCGKTIWKKEIERVMKGKSRMLYAKIEKEDYC